MSKVLLIGENPNGFTGNGLMMRGILNQIVDKDLDITLFCPFSDSITSSQNVSYAIIPSDDLKRQDIWGSQKLVNLLNSMPFDFVAFIGIDVWRYINVIGYIKQIQQNRGFRLIHLFPYDLQFVDKGFVQYANLMDIPCVYSKFGYDMLSPHVRNLQYFRPNMPNRKLFFRYDENRRNEVRQSLFPTISPETHVFGFIGPNQIRKDPQKLIKAFSFVKQMGLEQKSVLYLHTNFSGGVFDLQKYAISCGLDSGDLLVKPEGSYSPFERMPDIYNAIDCLVNCTMQEGLSWTVIQAMMCGTSVIASNSTAHIELLKGVSTLVPCKNETYIPIKTVNNSSNWIDAFSCRADDISSAMQIHQAMASGTTKDIVEKQRGKLIEKIKAWSEECSDFSGLLQNAVVPEKKPFIKAILFMQHSSAGDILMTTRCLKRIRERYGNLELHYMTQSRFFGLLHKNPDVQAVLEWDPELRKRYQVVFNPHGEHILKGGFNNLDIKLADMYPYFCGVKPGDFFIHCEKPNRVQLSKTSFIDFDDLKTHPYVVVHTTGGDPKYRTYSHMGLVVKGLTLPVIQIGSSTDLYCPGAIDLRGILSFNETAWVMKHAKVAIVIDSFPSHLAGALGTPCIVLYGPAPARVVGPIHQFHGTELWFDMEPNKLDVCPDMTNCHGRSTTCQSPCIDSINPMEIQDNLIKILSKVVPDV